MVAVHQVDDEVVDAGLLVVEEFGLDLLAVAAGPTTRSVSASGELTSRAMAVRSLMWKLSG